MGILQMLLKIFLLFISLYGATATHSLAKRSITDIMGDAQFSRTLDTLYRRQQEKMQRMDNQLLKQPFIVTY